MAGPTIRRLSVRGFRSYGPEEQTLKLPSDLTVVWAPNSQGKTSLAEAIEFLLAGRISRRDLTASVQDEFAGALRNAHLADEEEVYVEAELDLGGGRRRVVRRALLSDYSKRQDCTSQLEIDGVEATQEDLASLGIRFSQPPIEVPVLAQHNLTHLFSVGPLQRATYFKSLLEVTDLEELRAAVAGLVEGSEAPQDPDQSLLSKIEEVPAFAGAPAELQNAVLDPMAFNATFEGLAGKLLEAESQPVPSGLEARLLAIKGLLDERLARAFPVAALELGSFRATADPNPGDWAALENFAEERARVDLEEQRLIALFQEALRIPAVSELAEPGTCPLCETPGALTPNRVRAIREAVQGAAAYQAAKSAARAAVLRIQAQWSASGRSAKAAIPEALGGAGRRRRSQGLTVANIRELLGKERADELLRPWLRAYSSVLRSGRKVRQACDRAVQLASAAAADLYSRCSVVDLRDADTLLTQHGRQFASDLQDLSTRSAALLGALSPVIASKSTTVGWSEFLALAGDRDRVRGGLLEAERWRTLQGELVDALRDIDRGKEEVLEEKFATHSEGIAQWWERLRPGATTFFAALRPRKGAKRTIDLKAGLAPDEERTAPQVRDVVAVFSQSQMHCLGLALFLAKAEREGFGFIVLDDPVLANDDDYRVHFSTTVLEALLGTGVQVILLTQDHRSWEDIETRFRHRGVAVAQLYVETPAQGTVIENTSDGLTAKLNRADSLSRGGHPDPRKECGLQLRDAGERFCKEILARERRASGDTTVAIADYDGKTLEWLVPKVIPHLTSDPSHPGKLEAFKRTVNDACHDNAPPGGVALRQTCGDLRHLAKVYLGL